MNPHAIPIRVGFLFIAAILYLASVFPAMAMECEDYTKYVRLVAGHDMSGQGSDVVLRNDIAYVGTDGTLKILDIADPENPIDLAAVGRTGSTRITLHGDLAYVTYEGYTMLIDDLAGFQIYDITDPAAPVLLSDTETTPVMLGRSVRVGDHLLIGAWEGLRVYDVTDPAAPVFIDEFPGIGGISDIVVNGDIAYLSSVYGSPSGVQVVDISVPTAPVLLSTVPDTSSPAGMELAGDLLLVAEGPWASKELLLLDVAMPETPVIRSRFALNGAPRDVCLKGDTAFVACNPGTIELVDVSNPDLPLRLGNVTIGPSLWPNGITCQGDLIFASTYNDNYSPVPHTELVVVNATIPGFPPLVGADINYAANAMAIDGNQAYLAAGTGGVVSVDISNPEYPAVRSVQAVVGQAIDIDLALPYAYVASGSGGINIVDVSDPSNLSSASQLSIPGTMVAIAVEFPIAYLGTQDGELVVVDISNSSSPSVIATLDLGSGCADIAVSGDWLYLVGGPEFHIVDIANPAAPSLFDSSNGSDWTVYDNLIVSGELLFVGNHWNWDEYFGNGVSVRDISDPSDPVVLGGYALNGVYQRSMAASGDVLYVDGGGVYVFDFSDPSEMSYLGLIPGSPRAMGIAADERLIMFGRDGSSPEPLLSAALHCADLTSVEEGPVATPGLVELSAWPNPFNPSTKISFVQPADGPAKLTIHGLDGRLLRSLIDANLPEGKHEFSWEGRDDAGRTMASGVYLVRVHAAGMEGQEKLILLK